MVAPSLLFKVIPVQASAEGDSSNEQPVKAKKGKVDFIMFTCF